MRPRLRSNHECLFQRRKRLPLPDARLRVGEEPDGAAHEPAGPGAARHRSVRLALLGRQQRRRHHRRAAPESREYFQPGTLTITSLKYQNHHHISTTNYQPLYHTYPAVLKYKAL